MKRNRTDKRRASPSFRGLLRLGAAAFFLGLLLADGPRPADAFSSSGATYRITRSAVNQGGRAKTSTGFRMNASAGEASRGLVTGATYRVADGLMKIYFYPGTISNVSLTQGAGAGEINMTWTSPGADGNQQTAASYVVKYSTFTSPGSIDNQVEFENAATFSQALSPKAPGQGETLTLTGLQPGTSYYIAIEARDGDKNQGYLSNSKFTWAQVAVLAVDIQNLDGDPNSYGYGTLQMSSAVVSTATIRVTNTGTTAATWSLRAATTTAGSPWQVTTGALALDQFRVSAGFDEVFPAVGAFGAEDRMSGTDVLSSGTAFTIDGSSTGVSVPIAHSRNVWFLLETPLASSTTGQQDIQVTVTANTP